MCIVACYIDFNKGKNSIPSEVTFVNQSGFIFPCSISKVKSDWLLLNTTLCMPSLAFPLFYWKGHFYVPVFYTMLKTS